MIATIQFDLNDPNEIESFKRVNKSVEMALALLKIKELNMSRKMLKEINNILDEYKIDLEDIIS